VVVGRSQRTSFFRQTLWVGDSVDTTNHGKELPAPTDFGITLTLTPTKECGRRTGPADDGHYQRYQYRPDWALPWMTGHQAAGAWIVALGKTPLALGETTIAVISPLSPPVWELVKVGDRPLMSEGARIVGRGLVEWKWTTDRPLSSEDEEHFVDWVLGRTDRVQLLVWVKPYGVSMPDGSQRKPFGTAAHGSGPSSAERSSVPSRGELPGRSRSAREVIPPAPSWPPC
jgi:hypothetical protein